MRRLLLASMILAAACGRPESPLDQSDESVAPAIIEREEAPPTPPGLTLSRLFQNVAIGLPVLGTQRVTLRGGLYERRTPFLVVRMEEGLHVVGDLDGDGRLEAAVVVSLLQGLPQPGSGPPSPLSHLVIFTGDQAPSQEATLQLPARTRVIDFRGARGIIDIDLAESRPGDPPGTWSGRRTVRYRYSNGNFTPM